MKKQLLKLQNCSKEDRKQKGKGTILVLQSPREQLNILHSKIYFYHLSHLFLRRNIALHMSLSCI